MAYIGRQLVRGQNRVLDDISGSFNGSTTAFNLTVSSSSSPPASVNQLWIILGGVLQKPGTDFTVADAVLTFTTAPASTLSFWGMIQGDTSDINSPADASVTPSKIANSGDFAFPADVRFKDADGSHYVGLQAPSTVSSNLVWSLPAADGSANQLLKTDGSGNLGWASDTQSNLLDEDNMSSNSATQPASQQSIKAYVDAGDLSLIDEDNMSTNSATRPPSQQSVKAYADTKAVLTGSTNNTICTVTGAHAITGEAKLTFNGSGDLTVTGNEGTSANLYLIADEGDDNGDGWRVGSNQDDNDLTFANNLNSNYLDKFTLTSAGNATFAGNVACVNVEPTNNINLPDSKRVYFGAGNDMGIYHNGTTNIVDIAASQQLYFKIDSANKFYVQSGGAQFVGSLYADDDNKIELGSSQDFSLWHDGSDSVIKNTVGALQLQCTNTVDVRHTSTSDPVLRFVNTANTSATASNVIRSIHDVRTCAEIRLGRNNDANDFSASAGSTQGDIQFWTTQSGTLSRKATFINSGGLCFGTDTAAANALDDYEEGTWTPTDDSGDSLTFSTPYETPTYVKIGKLIYFQADITWPTNSGGNHPKLNNPFTGASNYGGGHVNWTTYAGGLVVHVGANDFWLSPANDSDSSLTNAALSGKRVIFATCYQLQ